jgi:fatty acid desaturase
MEDKSNLAETLFERTEEYVKTSIELLKLKILEKITEIVSSIIARLILTIFIVLCLLMLSIGVSFWLGEMLNKIYYGFFIVAAFYVVAGVIFHFIIYNSVKKRIINSIIKSAL